MIKLSCLAGPDLSRLSLMMEAGRSKRSARAVCRLGAVLQVCQVGLCYTCHKASKMRKYAVCGEASPADVQGQWGSRLSVGGET